VVEALNIEADIYDIRLKKEKSWSQRWLYRNQVVRGENGTIIKMCQVPIEGSQIC
jgi:hypothetical protein